MNFRLLFFMGRAVLASVFFLAAIHKIMDPESFAVLVFRYHLLPDAWINLVAITLPWVELVVAWTLLVGSRYKTAAIWSSLILLSVFSIVVGFNLLRGLEIACGCFTTSPASDPAGYQTILRNVAGIALAATLLLEGRDKPLRLFRSGTTII